jgi:glutamate dehydrogenase/leucine dehydrogenase
MDLTREYEEYHDECFTTGEQYTNEHPHIGKAKLALGAIYTIEEVIKKSRRNMETRGIGINGCRYLGV